MNKRKIAVVKALKDLQEQGGEYIDSVGSEFIGIIMDNEYCNTRGLMIDVLSRAFFKDMDCDVSWFLYDFKAGTTIGPHLITSDGINWTFHTNEDYYEYLRTL